MKIELIGGCTKEELEKRIKKITAAGKLSRFPGNVFEVLDSCENYEKNLKMIKRIIKMGHKSIIEHDYLVFAIADVTPIIEQIIIGNRLTSFTIKSRREVDFRTAGFYIPDFRDKEGNIHKDNLKLKEKYEEHMKYLFDIYAQLVDRGISTEDARFILPYCFHSNIIMGLDGRELEKMIISFTKGPLSKISEIKEFGNKLLDIVKEYVPYLIESIENENIIEENYFKYLEDMEKRPEIKILDKPELVSYTQNADDVVLLSEIMYHYQCSKNQAEEILNNISQKDEKAKEKMMDVILHKEERRELEQVNFTFQIPISLSILTHLTRHRMHSLLVPEFTPIWDFNNYIIPDKIKLNGREKFEEAVNKNIEMFNEFNNEGILEEDLIYFYIGAQMCNVMTTMNARTVQWICRMRCCNKAQWQIRNIAKEIAKQVKQVAPLIGKGLGPTCITDKYCGEGKESCGLIERI
ncbi:MAG: FAD-dependent thymidylate synthase [Candidatus Scatovivens sp.]